MSASEWIQTQIQIILFRLYVVTCPKWQTTANLPIQTETHFEKIGFQTTYVLRNFKYFVLKTKTMTFFYLNTLLLFSV